MNDGCEFNPKNLPTKKTGTCQNPEHYDWTDNKPKRGNEVHLVMDYSFVYQETWCNCNKKNELSDDEYDKLYEEMEMKRYRPNSETYYCDKCCEVLIEDADC